MKELVTMGLLNNSSDPEVIRVWTEGLCEIPYYALRAGLKKARDFTGYFNLPAFRELCRVTAQELGLPAPHAAYVEACMHSSGHAWSHPAIYHAAQLTGYHELRSMTERDIYPLWLNNYETVCKRILNGEQLGAPIQKALPDKPFRPADENHAKSRLQSMKDLLG